MTTVMRWSGRQTRALRQARRMSVRAFAAHLGVAVASVTNWERRGEQIRMRDETQQILDRDLSLASDEVQARFQAAMSTPPAPPTGDGCGSGVGREPGPPSPDLPDQRPADDHRAPALGLRELGGDLKDLVDTPVERREALLRAIAVLAGAFGLLSGSEPTRPRRLGHADVARLNAVTALYRSMDSECGSGMLYRDAARFAEAASRLLDRTRFTYSGGLAPILLASVAAARHLAGWTALDATRHSDAQRHLLFAERAAIAAGDVLLAANVRYAQARQFQHLGHDQDAVDTLRHARDHLGGTATPAVAARLHGSEATSLAALGDAQAALNALGKAREAFDRIKPDREPDWIRFFDRAELLAEHATVHRNLARHDRARHGGPAVRCYTEAIAAFGPQQARSSVLNEVGLCSALFLADKPEQALAAGTRVVARAGQLTSHRAFDRIRDLRRDATGHTSRADVADFLRTLTALSPATA